jgi:hypothetical protein
MLQVVILLGAERTHTVDLVVEKKLLPMSGIKAWQCSPQPVTLLAGTKLFIFLSRDPD